MQDPSEGRVFKWRIAEVPVDDGSLGLKYVNMWDLFCALANASHGDTKTRRKVLDRNADVIVGIIKGVDCI